MTKAERSVSKQDHLQLGCHSKAKSPSKKTVKWSVLKSDINFVATMLFKHKGFLGSNLKFMIVWSLFQIYF